MARLLKLGVYDSVYLEQFYMTHPGLCDADHDTQHRTLIEDRAASSDFWSAALALRGHVTADLIANARPLQRAWAAGHGKNHGQSWLFDTVTAQVAAFRPDVLIVAEHTMFGPDILARLRSECPSLRLIIGWCGAPYRDISILRAWDVALSCIPAMVDSLRAAGLVAHHVDHGFDPRLLPQLAVRASEATAFSFLGSIHRAPGYHGERSLLLDQLIDRTPLEIWSSASISQRGIRPLLRRLAGRGPGPAARASQPPLFGLAMFERLRDSAVTLNTHIDVSPANASNMRLFEATGVGTCLLTDAKLDLARLFAADTEVVTYASAEEAVEKYKYLADHPLEAEIIGAAGQRRTLRDHNFNRRAEQIDDILRLSGIGI